MDHAILNTTYARFKFKLDELLKALATLAYEVNTPDLQRVIDDLRSNLDIGGGQFLITKQLH